MNMVAKKLILFVLVLFFCLSPVAARQFVISNSQDWRDVYSVELFANLIHAKPYFLVSMRHASLLLNQLPHSNNHSALIVSSSRLPYVVNYADLISTLGIKTTEIKVYDANLELVNRLNVTNFIIVDDSYGYNAISVAPYAILKRAYVLFADENNIAEVVRFLASRKVDELIIYGIVDRIVADSLQKFNPIIINTGDRFSDNIEIVKRYQAIKHSKQAVFTNGEFIEQEVVSGKEPIIFIGKNNVPEVVKDYIKNSEIEIGVLIGNDLISTATIIRRQLGISVFVKFAQGARAPTGPISKVEALDMFRVPRIIVKIDVASILYNTATGLLEVTYQNLEDISTFVKSTITLTTEQNERQVVGDEQPVFIRPLGFKTLTYKVDRFTGSNITARVFSIFGDAPKSLEMTLDKTLEVTQVSVEDRAQINVTAVYYDFVHGKFLIEVENIGSVNSYVDAEIRDMKVGYRITNLGTEESVLVKPGEKKKLTIIPDEELKAEDIAMNKLVKVRVYFGERKNALVNLHQASFEVKEIRRNYVLWATVILIVLLLLFLILLKLRVKCDKCGHRNMVYRKTCSKCGTKL